mmetsp:Transcript_49161/g.97705  ORF Transcript_49161/g.97705 Transcript_49161/m.97705 type:complete len:334 (-) Transcript_49161:84-1085(-)
MMGGCARACQIKLPLWYSKGAAVFAASILLLSLKPVLLHIAAAWGGPEQLPPDRFMFMTEVLKLAICTVAVAARRGAGLHSQIWVGFRHTSAFAIPATLYMIMNIFVVVAGRRLPPPTFQLLASTKIICTALASWAILKKKISPAQWIAVALLTVGVALGQWRNGALMADEPFIPVLLMLVNSCLSAVAAVYTEKIIKAHSNAALTIYATNVHMAAHTLVISSCANALRANIWQITDPEVPSALLRVGPLTLVALCNEAVNGVMMSLLMRHADSIVKNYAFGISIFTTAGLAVPLLDYWPPPLFYIGATLVVFSMGLYASNGLVPHTTQTKLA